MATTTNYSWTTPDDTDLVKDGASAIRSLGSAIDSTVFTNAGNAVQKSTIDAKGDLLVGTADNTITRLAVGTNNYVLTADSGEATGLKWAAPAGGSFSGVLLTGTSAQTISNTTETAITFNTETYDTDGYHDNASNTSRITIPSGKSGYYLINLMVAWAVNGTDGHRTVYLKKNATTYLHGGASIRPSGVVSTSVMYSMIVNLTAADYIEIYVYQNVGGNLNVDKDSTYPNTFFNAQYLGA